MVKYCKDKNIFVTLYTSGIMINDFNNALIDNQQSIYVKNIGETSKAKV